MAKEVATNATGNFGGFGITEKNVESRRVDFPLDEVYNAYKAGTLKNPFHQAVIKGIEHKATVPEKYTLAEGVELEKDAKPTPDQVIPECLRHTLQFHFESPNGMYYYNHTIWDVASDAKKPAEEKQWILDEITNLWAGIVRPGTAVMYLSNEKLTEALGQPVNSWGDFFKAVAIQFNTMNGGKPAFVQTIEDVEKPVVYQIKLTRSGQGKNPNRISLPKFDNAVERVLADVGSRLSVKPNDVYKMIEQQSAAPKVGAGPTSTGTAGGSAWPDFPS